MKDWQWVKRLFFVSLVGALLVAVRASASPSDPWVDPDDNGNCPPGWPKKTTEGGFVHCENLQTNPNSCGLLGHVCPGQNAACVKGQCVDLYTDAANCGKVGQACPKGHICCFPGQCLDASKDNRNCGACNKSCDAVDSHHVCHGGKCVDSNADVNACGDGQRKCGAGQECCGGSCVTLSTGLPMSGATWYCGSCGVTCDLSNKCVQGKCVPKAGMTACNGTSVSLKTDNANCGRCSHACPDNTLCTNGTCKKCPRGQISCFVYDPNSKATEGYCTDPKTDADNCHQCFRQCQENWICEKGHCRY